MRAEFCGHTIASCLTSFPGQMTVVGDVLHVL